MWTDKTGTDEPSHAHTSPVPPQRVSRPNQSWVIDPLTVYPPRFPTRCNITYTILTIPPLRPLHSFLRARGRPARTFPRTAFFLTVGVEPWCSPEGKHDSGRTSALSRWRSSLYSSPRSCDVRTEGPPFFSLLRLRDTASKRSPGLTFLFYSVDFTDRMETHTSLCQSSTIATFSAVCGTVGVTLKSSAL